MAAALTLWALPCFGFFLQSHSVLPVATELLGKPSRQTGQVHGSWDVPVRQSGIHRPDVLLITVDTLRADAALSMPSPGDWLVFDQAVSPAPWTSPSFYSLFTGLPVVAHGGGLPLGDQEYSKPLEGLPWLTEVIVGAGYETAAWTCNPHLVADAGFSRGFKHFVHSDSFFEPHLFHHSIQEWRHRFTGRVQRLRHERDQLLVEGARRWLSSPATKPRFTWVHLLAPHEYQRDLAVDMDGWKPGMEDLELLWRAYALNVAATEDRIRWLLEVVDFSDTVVVFTSDHGEAFGETGYRGHGKGRTDAELLVPLAMAGPGVEPGRVGGQVAVRDLAATILELLHIPRAMPGQNLMENERDAVAVGGLRWDPETFALRRAGGEYARTAPPAATGAPMVFSDDTLRNLGQLGYVESP